MKMDGMMDDAHCWAAVQRRDASYAGAFVYAVQTTGVYCRPGCASRTPRRANVVFFATPAAAAAAGYRPCKRCAPASTPPAAVQQQLVAQACATLAAAEVPPTLDELAAAAGLSPYHFHRLFKRLVGVTPHQYAQAHRRQRLHAALPHAASVTDAVYDAGYPSLGAYYHADTPGMAAQSYRNGGADVAIQYAVVACSLGYVLVAATERGLCRVALGDDAATLADELHALFPRAQQLAPAVAFGVLVAQVVAALDGTRADAPALPLDIQGTAFQQRVWAALQRIPAGSTATYSDIAAAIGQPQAVRAVAQACAANPLAVVIPCHRVLRRDGGLGGYRWGVSRKHALLHREGALPAPPDA